MIRYVGRRLLLAVPTLFGITVIVFVLLHLAPGSPGSGSADSLRHVSGKAAAEMRRQIDALVGEHARAGAILARAEQSGMEVSQAQFDLEGARSALVKARAAVHAFTPEAVKRETEPGLAIGSKAYARGVRALEELAFRRKGLAVSVVIILALIGGLVLKIRQLEGGRPVPGSGGGERSDVL